MTQGRKWLITDSPLDTTRRAFLALVAASVPAGSLADDSTDTDGQQPIEDTKMTQITDYHGWEIPTEGDDIDRWDSILKDLIGGPLEASVALRGPLDERPPTAPADALYHATDRDEFYRYDSAVDGWVTASAHVDEARQRHDSAQGPMAAYQQIGAGSLGDLRHTQQTVGTRRMACHWPLVDPHFRADDFSYSNSGVNERVQLINYSFLEQSPNMVPVLRGQCIFKSEVPESSFNVGVRLKTQPSDEWLMTFRAADGADSTIQLYDECYLHEAPYGSAARGTSTLAGTQIEVHADIDDTPTAGTIHGSSQLMLDWEVV